MSHLSPQQLRILETLDVDGARLWMAMPAAGKTVTLTALHKARYENPQVKAALRQESRAWLEVRNYKRVGGKPWPKGEALP